MPAKKRGIGRGRPPSVYYTVIRHIVLHWEDDTAEYVRHRDTRYPGAIGVEPEWAQEALNDPLLAALEPDPKSHMGASRFIGYSPSAAHVLTVIVWRDDDGDAHLINAWRATGADLRLYLQEEPHGEDD